MSKSFLDFLLCDRRFEDLADPCRRDLIDLDFLKPSVCVSSASLLAASTVVRYDFSVGPVKSSSLSPGCFSYIVPDLRANLDVGY